MMFIMPFKQQLVDEILGKGYVIGGPISEILCGFKVVSVYEKNQLGRLRLLGACNFRYIVHHIKKGHFISLEEITPVHLDGKKAGEPILAYLVYEEKKEL